MGPSKRGPVCLQAWLSVGCLGLDSKWLCAPKQDILSHFWSFLCVLYTCVPSHLSGWCEQKCESASWILKHNMKLCLVISLLFLSCGSCIGLGMDKIVTVVSTLLPSLTLEWCLDVPLSLPGLQVTWLRHPIFLWNRKDNTPSVLCLSALFPLVTGHQEFIVRNWLCGWGYKITKSPWATFLSPDSISINTPVSLHDVRI